MEQKRINEEYKIWKKNVPFLYDTLYARALKWPTLTAQWLPDVQDVDGTELRQHRLLIGTNTSKNDDDNYLQIVHVRVPKMDNPEAGEYNESTNEIGGYGAGKEKFEFEVRQKIKHPSEVNKARYMPQNANLIATWSVDDGVLIWDRTKHTLDAEKDKGEPELTCDGHEKEGFGLSWSPHNEGQLATASEDETVRLWDVDATSKKNGKIDSLQTWRHHSSVVNDVQHHPIHKSWIATASDDLTWAIIDPRQSSKSGPAFRVSEAHADAINAIACHPKFEFTVATGSADKTVALWDLRAADKKVHSIEAHQDAVIQLQWHPQEPAILTSGSYDRRIIIYDLSRTGEEQTEEEAEEGAPEM